MNSLSLFNPAFSDIFDAFDRGMNFLVPATTASAPRVDVKETENAYIMEMELPGYKDKDVEISLKDRILSISSRHEDSVEKKAEGKDNKAGEYLIRERRMTSFSRKFTLPADINPDAVQASFKDGILEINIPRRPENQPKMIEIKTT